jgi:hypothetical protein
MQQTIKVKHIDARLITGILALSIVVVLLVFVVIPWLRGAESPAAPAYWPTTGWRRSAPEAQGISSDKLAELLLHHGVRRPTPGPARGPDRRTDLLLRV